MKPFKHPKTNVEIGKPANWNDEIDGRCDSLPVVRCEGCLFSFWHTTWRERILILFGRPIRLCVRGNTHPPVWIDGEKV